MRTDRIECYRNIRGQFHWRWRASNGRIVANCAEPNGYKTRSGLRRAVARVLARMAPKLAVIWR